MSRRTPRTLVLAALLAALALPASLAAQQAPASRSDRKSGTYLKLGLAHWQGDIFSESSLTQWNVDLFGASYDLTSLDVRIERYFGRALLVSGFGVGYRKDAIRRADSGHMLNATLFRDVDLTVVALKAGAGVEWGVPALTFDQTEFDTLPDGTLRYRHTYPRRNSSVPFVGTRTSATVYPYLEFSALQRPGPFLLEAGMRINMMRFHFDDYEVGPADRVTHAFTDRRVLVPYLFASLGVRLF